MNKNIFQVIIEKEGVSDDFYKVVSINCKDGSFVEKGQLILCIETSKASIDIASPIDGYIFYDIQENDEVTVGQVIAIISESETFDKSWFTSSNNDTLNGVGFESDMDLTKWKIKKPRGTKSSKKWTWIQNKIY